LNDKRKLANRYELGDLIGRGGMAEVFEAVDTRLNRTVAIKILRDDLARDPAFIARFRREAQAAAALNHPTIVAVYDTGEEIEGEGRSATNVPYIVMEYVNGTTLRDIVKSGRKLQTERALRISIGVLDALGYSHAHGIIHRDIKPSNIMRRHDGRLFLLDFGAVKQVTNTPANSSSSTGIYSMGFAPPEQMAGNQVFPSTDLYALAVTVITLLTGQEASKLFDAYTNQWQWRSQISINPRLADILDKMLLPAASQRFQSSQEVLEALFPASVAQTVLPPTQPPNLQPPQPIKSVQPAFATWELLAGAAFSGFEGALIAIALFSLVKNPIITLTVAAVILNGLIFAQTKRWLEKFDLLIIPAVSFAIIFFIPFLRSNIAIEQVIILAIVAALISISVTALFRLVYKLMSSIL